MGSLIAYEVSLKLFWKYKVKPKMIFFAASSPPHIPSIRKNMCEMNDQMFFKELVDLGGMSPEVVNNSDILDLFLPIIRSDLRLIHNYDFTKQMLPLPADIVVLYSDEDNVDGRIWEWGRYTEKVCHYHHFVGGHFFINNYSNEIVDIINNKLA